MTGEDLGSLVDQHRDVEAEAFDAAGNLLDLPGAVAPRIRRIREEGADCDNFDSWRRKMSHGDLFATINFAKQVYRRQVV